MELTAVRLDRSPVDPERLRLTARVTGGASGPRGEEIWFDVPDFGGRSPPAADPWLAALLPLAMVRGEPLVLRAPADPLLLSRARGLMRIWSGWYPDLVPVPVEADETVPPEAHQTVPPAADETVPAEAGGAAGSEDAAPVDPARRDRKGGAGGVAALFSGGVDSLFTVLRPRGAVGPGAASPGALILVRGFDIPLSAAEAFERAEALARAAAARAGRRLLVISTNLRETSWRETPWGWLGHGAALAAAALALGDRHRTVYVPATGGYRDLHPWGSHPLTDRLFSTSRTAFVHDGAAYSRTEKLEFLSTRPHALETLRVCWESRSGLNCGACTKCLRTALALALLGALDRCATLDGPIDLERIARLPCEHSWDYREMADIRTLADERGRPDVSRAISRAISRARARGWLLEWRERFRMPGRRNRDLYRERRPWRRWVGGRGRGRARL